MTSDPSGPAQRFLVFRLRQDDAPAPLAIYEPGGEEHRRSQGRGTSQNGARDGHDLFSLSVTTPTQLPCRLPGSTKYVH